MNLLGFIYTICAIYGIGFLFWMNHTKSGRKWKDSLN